MLVRCQVLCQEVQVFFFAIFHFFFYLNLNLNFILGIQEIPLHLPKHSAAESINSKRIHQHMSWNYCLDLSYKMRISIQTSKYQTKLLSQLLTTVFSDACSF